MKRQLIAALGLTAVMLGGCTGADESSPTTVPTSIDPGQAEAVSSCRNAVDAGGEMQEDWRFSRTNTTEGLVVGTYVPRGSASAPKGYQCHVNFYGGTDLVQLTRVVDWG
jgi:hypothetical protein